MQTWRAISAMPLEHWPDAQREFALGFATLSMGPIAGPRTGQFRGRNPRVRAEVPRVAKDVAQSWSANAEGLYDIDVLAIAIDPAGSHVAVRRDRSLGHIPVPGRRPELERVARSAREANPSV